MTTSHLNRCLTEEALNGALRRFPLVARPRLPCASLDTRLAEIEELAHAATTATDPTALTAIVHNKAALIASDVGLHPLARELCWRHHDRYASRHPWTAQLTRFALEPLINLARLDIRQGHADKAIALLTTLASSVATGAPAVIDGGRTVHINDHASGSEGHQNIRLWLWMLVLSEGLRGLAAAGSWHDALIHAERHHGIGQRLLDGRQIAIIAHATTGDHDLAARLIAGSELPTPWEHAVAAALATTDVQADSTTIETMVEQYLALDLDSEHAAFSIRLGLSVVDLAGGPHHPHATRAVRRVRSIAASASDAYVARNVIDHPVFATLGACEQAQLHDRLRAAGLDGSASFGLEHHLTTALNHCPPAA